MGGKKIWIGVLVAVIIVVAFTAVHALMKVEGRSNDYVCSDNATDPYCACMTLIGDERWCGASKSDEDGGTTTQWSTDCEGDTCYAITDCDNGASLSCSGEYSAQADEEGVRCTDSGSGGAIAETDYCSNYD